MTPCSLSRVVLCLFLIVGILSAAKASTSDGSHEHDHELWEIASVYDLEATTYTATVATVDGEVFDEDGLAFMIFSTSSADVSGLEDAEETAEPGETANGNGCLDLVHLL